MFGSLIIFMAADGLIVKLLSTQRCGKKEEER